MRFECVLVYADVDVHSVCMFISLFFIHICLHFSHLWVILNVLYMFLSYVYVHLNVSVFIDVHVYEHLVPCMCCVCLRLFTAEIAKHFCESLWRFIILHLCMYCLCFCVCICVV